jgi:hypothetical protein
VFDLKVLLPQVTIAVFDLNVLLPQVTIAVFDLTVLLPQVTIAVFDFKVLLRQVTIAVFDYPVWCSAETLNYLAFQSLDFDHVMKVTSETRRVHYIRYLCLYFKVEIKYLF